MAEVSGGSKVAEALKSIPEKKEKLRKAFESLQSSTNKTSALSFAFQWSDLEDHFSAIENSIHHRFEALQQSSTKQQQQQQQQQEGKDDDDGDDDEVEAAATPRPDLRSLCVRMDAKGLRSFMSEHQADAAAVREELGPALRCAPDPVLLALDAILEHGSNIFSRPGKRRKGGGRRGNGEAGTDPDGDCRIIMNLLTNVFVISPEMAEIKPWVREKAKNLAFQWKANIPQSGDNASQVLAFLQLIVSYNLVSEFAAQEVMELFISISRRKQALDLIKCLGLVDKLPDLIQKLNSKGRQLDVVKFVYAFRLTDKFPPVPLLKAYIAECERRAQEIVEKGGNSVQNEATAKEMGALQSVLKAVADYKLESEYPLESLVRSIAQLEQKKAEKKRTAAAAAAAALNSKPQQQQSNKRTHLPSAKSAATVSGSHYSPLIQAQSQLGLVECAESMGAAAWAPYGLAATSSVYSHGSPRSYHSLESLVGTSSMYNRPLGYPFSGNPSSYDASGSLR